jgi:Fe-S cluster biogenesis protein NfuA
VIDERIRLALRETVAPALGLDPRELELTAFADGIASIRLGPACHGCSGTLMALVQSIEAELRAVVPEVELVEAVA